MIRFGTSGWRGIIGKEVTFRNVRVVTRAILDVLCSQAGCVPPPGPLLISYDTRMLSAKFADTAAQLATAQGCPVLISSRDVPAPAFSHALRQREACAGILFTGSHNPPEYNGLKLYTPLGTLAEDNLTRMVEEKARVADPEPCYLQRPELVAHFDPKQDYLESLDRLIDWEAIRKAALKVVVDPLFGSAREYLDHILLEHDVDVVVIHNTRDPYFGGYAPNCTSPALTRLRSVMRQHHAHLGLATDGDADRFGILDVGARLKQPSLVLALLLDYLVRRKGLRGAVGRTVATSHLLDRVAEMHGLEVVETRVGFKNFGRMLAEGRLEFAGEESAGLAWARHLPERDGILACLLVLEMVSREGATLVELAQRLFERTGPLFYSRTQVALTERLERRLESLRGEKFKKLDGLEVAKVDTRDGLKVCFADGSWLMIRKAGTEPRIRLHAEASTKEALRHRMHLARRLLAGHGRFGE